jgi:hypothetical protein
MHAAAVLFLPFRALVFTREFQLLFDEFWPRIYGPVDVPRSDRVVSEIQLVVENPFRVCLACGRTRLPIAVTPGPFLLRLQYLLHLPEDQSLACADCSWPC